MPKYRVDGADAETGAEASVVVEAPNAVKAKAFAAARGITNPRACRALDGSPADTDKRESTDDAEASPRRPTRRTFEVQTIDPGTGHESWATIVARDAEAARAEAIDAGFVVGGIQLKSVEVEAPPLARKSLQRMTREACPDCGTELTPAGKGLHGAREVLTVLILLLLWIVPGLLAYFIIDRRPWCPKCRSRK
jgi:hypothetical protein